MRPYTLKLFYKQMVNRQKQYYTPVRDNHDHSVVFSFGTFRNFKHYYLFFIKGTMKS